MGEVLLRQMFSVPSSDPLLKALPPVLCSVDNASLLDHEGEARPGRRKHTQDKGLSHPMMGKGGQGPVQWSLSAPFSLAPHLGDT